MWGQTTPYMPSNAHGKLMGSLISSTDHPFGTPAPCGDAI